MWHILRAYLCDKVKVVHSVDLALVLCSGDHLALHIFIIRDGEALAHGAGGHELSAMRVVDGILQKTTEPSGQTIYAKMQGQRNMMPIRYSLKAALNSCASFSVACWVPHAIGDTHGYMKEVMC